MEKNLNSGIIDCVVPQVGNKGINKRKNGNKKTKRCVLFFKLKVKKEFHIRNQNYKTFKIKTK